MCFPFNLALQLLFLLFVCSFLNTINYSSSESLKYTGGNLNVSKSYGQLNRSLHMILPLLTSTSISCVFSENSQILAIFTNMMMSFKLVFYFANRSSHKCNNIIVFGEDNCRSNFNLHTNPSAFSIYFVDSLIGSNISSLESCFNDILSAEAMVVLLRDDSIYELSPVVPRPRCLTRSSIAEVMSHRDKPRKLDLAGTNLTVATMDYFPFFMVVDKNKGEFDGIEELLINEMSKHLNFTPDYLIFKNWGELLPNGTWVAEVCGTMQEGRAEVAIATIWQIHSLYTVMDFGPSINKIRLGFVVRRPDKIDFQWQTVLTIFKIWTWLATLLTLVLVVLIYWAGINYGLHAQSESWAGSVVTVFGHLTMSTSHSKGRDSSTRLTLTSWSVFSLLFTTALSTGIVTRLTLPQYLERVDTLRQLVKGHYYWSVDFYKRFRRNKEMREFMFDFEDPWASDFEKTYIHLKSQEIVKRVETDKQIAVPVQTAGEHLVLNTEGLYGHEALKNFRFSKETTTETHSSIGVKKMSPLLEPMAVLNLKFVEAGLVEYWQKDVYRRWSQYDTSHMSVELDIPTLEEPQPLLLHILLPVFYLLLFGLAIASIVFVVEVNW